MEVPKWIHEKCVNWYRGDSLLDGFYETFPFFPFHEVCICVARTLEFQLAADVACSSNGNLSSTFSTHYFPNVLFENFRSYAKIFNARTNI
jgi:hypothetical protein